MEPILLADIPQLVFRKNEWTTYRRTKAFPQLELVGRNARRYAQRDRPDYVKCVNRGALRGTSPVWQCSADLHPGLELGNTEVICEGYSGPGDAYVLPGSCQLQYELLGTRQHPQHTTYTETVYDTGSSGSFVGGIVALVCAIIFLVILIRGIIRCLRPRAPRPFIPRPANAYPAHDTCDQPAPININISPRPRPWFDFDWFGGHHHHYHHSPCAVPCPRRERVRVVQADVTCDERGCRRNNDRDTHESTSFGTSRTR